MELKFKVLLQVEKSVSIDHRWSSTPQPTLNSVGDPFVLAVVQEGASSFSSVWSTNMCQQRPWLPMTAIIARTVADDGGNVGPKHFDALGPRKIGMQLWFVNICELFIQLFIPGIGSKSCEKVGSCGPGAPKMKPSLVEEEDDDMPDSGSMKSLSQVSQMQSRTQRQPSEDVGKSSSRAACDAIQGVAFGTATEVEVRIEDSSDVDGEVLKEKSMHLPMRCNYFEATDRLPTLCTSERPRQLNPVGTVKVVRILERRRRSRFRMCKMPTRARKLQLQQTQSNSPHRRIILIQVMLVFHKANLSDFLLKAMSSRFGMRHGA